MKFRPLRAGISLFCAIAATLSAQTVTWIPDGTNNLFNNSANWVGGVVPPTNASAVLQFPLSGIESVSLPTGSLSFGGLQFQVANSSSSLYTFTTPGTSALSLQSGGLTKYGTAPANFASVVFSPGISIFLAANQTWTVNGASIGGAIAGAGKLTFAPTTTLSDASYGVGNRRGFIELKSTGSFAGGFEAQWASVILGNAASLSGSSGPIRLMNSDLRLDVNATIASPVTFNGSVGFLKSTESDLSLTLSGLTTLDGSVTLFGGTPTALNGKIAESTPSSRLTIQGRLSIGGDNSTGAYTGGTSVDANSAVVFTSASAVAVTNTISAADTGYVGAGFATNVQTALVNRLDVESFGGTLGFDSPNPAAPLNFNEPLDFSGFFSFRGIGSSSAAILNGTLNFGATQDYLFGGGGGRLTVASNLSNPTRGLILNAPHFESEHPLTVVLRGNNTFGNGILIQHGALIFDGPNALPATGAITFNQDNYIGYAGFTEAVGLTPNQFLARLNTSTITGSETTNIVGLDSTNPAAPRTVSTAIDLSLGGTITTPYFLGSATKVIVTGSIQPAGNQLKLTGVNGGHLVINSPFLPAVSSLVIGADLQGTVELNAPSNFAGGTTVASGLLLLGNSRALGTGLVSVEAGTLAATNNITLPNTVIGIGDALTFGQPGSSANLTLSGTVAAEQVNYQGGGQLKLTGLFSPYLLQINATGSGGVLVATANSFLNFDYFDYYDYYYYGYPGTFAGIPFNANLNSGYLAFSAPSAVLESISGNAGTQLIIHQGTNLTIINDFDGQTFNGTISGAGSLTFIGEQLSLGGNSTYSGGTTVSGGGLLRVASNTALGTGPLQVTHFGGGLQALVDGVTLANPISLQTLFDDANFDGGFGIVGELQLNLTGVVSGTGGFYKYDSGKLRLSGANTFSGGILLESGTIEFAHNNAAGNGPLIFDPFAVNDAKAVFTTAAPVIHGLANLGSIPAVVELAAGSNLTIDQNHYSVFTGSITGVGANNAKLTKTGFGGVTLFGTNSYSGGTFVTGGGIVFAATSAIPTTGSFVLSANGYIGFGGTNTLTDINNFLGKFDPANTLGTIGFDTSSSSPFLVTTPLDLKTPNFNFNARLGSATYAIISSTITPQSSAYRFGGGGGLLQVSSALIDQITPVPQTRSVVVDSPATTPLTLRLMSVSSTYSGGVSATQSALVFGPGLTLPATGAFTLGTGGYIGWEDTSLNTNNAAMSTYIGRFGTTNGIIGFDIAPGPITPRTISASIDLSNSGNAYLGTTGGSETQAGVRISGVITPSGNTYRFAGYKGGSLEIDSVLSGARSVVIGDPNVLATLVDPNRSVLDPLDPVYSTVILAAANTHTGNTTLNGGQLLLGGPSALGVSTNSLIVQSTAIPAGFVGEGLWRPQFGTTSGSNPTFANPIVLNSSLGLRGPNGFTLSGAISGSGGLFFDGDFGLSVRLSGNNTFTGGLTVTAGDLYLDSATAMGTGLLTLNEASEVFFGVSSTISGLASDVTNTAVIMENGVTLTVNQNTNTTYHGEFYSNGPLGARLVKTGTGSLRVEGENYGFVGIDSAGTRISADVQQGTLVVGGSGGALGSSAVRVSGGTLALDNSLVENNVLAVSGRLTGMGAFTGGTVAIGSNMVLAPGLAMAGDSPVGRLSFGSLNLTGGGVLEWNIQSFAGGGLGTDVIGVLNSNGLQVSSTSGSPFTVKVVSLLPNGGLGALSGLTAGETYSWVLFETNGVVGFDPTKFTVDASQFNSGVGTGFFSLSLSTTSSFAFTQAVMLNFSPVPEPSTWALMFGGVGALAFTLWRRRQGGRP